MPEIGLNIPTPLLSNIQPYEIIGNLSQKKYVKLNYIGSRALCKVLSRANAACSRYVGSRQPSWLSAGEDHQLHYFFLMGFFKSCVSSSSYSGSPTWFICFGGNRNEKTKFIMCTAGLV